MKTKIDKREKSHLKNSGVRIMKLKKFDKFQKVYVIVLELQKRKLIKTHKNIRAKTKKSIRKKWKTQRKRERRSS